MPLELWFPTPIYHAQLEIDSVENERMLERIYRLHEGRGSGHGLMDGGTTSYPFDRAVHCHEAFESFRRAVHEHARAFSAELGVDVEMFDPAIQDCWSSIYPAGASVRPHLHTNSMISGVYYVAAPEGCGATVFTNPLEYHKACDFPIFSKAHPASHDSCSYEARVGRLLLFPGWLKHHSEPNGSERDRVVVSFNMSFLVEPAE